MDERKETSGKNPLPQKKQGCQDCLGIGRSGVHWKGPRPYDHKKKSGMRWGRAKPLYPRITARKKILVIPTNRQQKKKKESGNGEKLVEKLPDRRMYGRGGKKRRGTEKGDTCVGSRDEREKWCWETLEDQQRQGGTKMGKEIQWREWTFSKPSKMLMSLELGQNHKRRQDAKNERKEGEKPGVTLKKFFFKRSSGPLGSTRPSSNFDTTGPGYDKD